MLNHSPKPQPKPPSNYVPTSDFLGVDDDIPLIRSSTELSKGGGIEVLELLKSCGMEKYHMTMLENGIDDMEIVNELSEEHLSDIGIPLGHRLKILKRIRELKGGKSARQ